MMDDEISPSPASETLDAEVTERKRALRVRLRRVRRGVLNPHERSERIWSHLSATPQYRGAESVLLFDSILGEPPTDRWRTAARRDGKQVWIPESASLPTASAVDLIVVPGIAFTPLGDRLGQGGGWYDRYLGAAPAATTIGVCFAAQLVAALPTEAHDRPVQLVICENGVVSEIPDVPDP